MLKVKNLSAGYGDIQILFNVSMEIKDGEVVALIGANAAGKTTTIKCISGLIKEISGEIYFEGKKINNIPAYERVNLGLIQVCEGRSLFPMMTVQENLYLGAYSKRARKKLNESLETVYELLPDLYTKKSQLAGSLSGGQQQMVAIGRGLMGVPKILIMDEPSLGLAPVITQRVFEIIEKIKEQGTTVLLVEQNVVKTLELADRGYVMENGRIIMNEEAKSLLRNDNLRKAYMGI
ncbi:MAG: ABC transporter ATP-binding protein [Dethiobacter sp.]|nr:ABC transporter ATP-binding protein [Dethiobacter sp.]